MKKSLLLLMCLVGAFACAWSQTSPFYVFKTANISANNAYATYYNVTIDGMNWEVPGNQAFDGFVRIGGKSITNVDRVITAKSPMGSTITKIVINHNGVNNSNLVVNSVTVQASSNSEFSTILSEEKITSPEIEKGVAGELEFTHDWTSGLYYKIIFNVTNSKNSNYGLDVASIYFYASSVVDNREQPTLTWSASEFEYVIGGDNEAFPALSKDPANLSGVKFVSSNEDVAVIDATTGDITVKAVGKTNISAIFDGDDNYKSAEATYLLNVSKPEAPGYFNFVDWKFPDADKWSSSYAKHIVEYNDAVITFESANKQSSTLTDCPVTKGNDVTLEITNKANDITSVSATFKQWPNKNQTVNLCTSANGEDFTETTFTTSDFAFSDITLPAGVKAIRFTFGNSNQIGIADITITETKVSTDPMIFAAADVDFGTTLTTFEAKTLKVTTANCTAPVTYKLSEGAEFTVAGTLTAEGGELTINCTATAVGVHTATLTLSSAGAEDVKVDLKAEIIKFAGTGEGTAQNPYDVTRAIDVIDNGLATTENVYVKGTISKVDKYNESFGSITYWLDENTFQVYGGLGINKVGFESIEDLTVGDEVVICGVIKKYNSTYELDKNNYIVAINYAENYPVTFDSNGMVTFSATKAAVFKEDSDVKAYVATSIDGDVVYMERITGTVAPNTGLVLAGQEGTVKIELTDDEGTVPESNMMHVWAPLATVEASTAGINNYVLGLLGEDFGFFNLAAPIDNTTGKGRAYLSTAMPARQLIIRFTDGSTSGIEEVNAAISDGDGMIFNIYGQQVDGSYKGLVIKNGQKYINK